MLNLQRPEQQRYVDIERTPLILLKGAAGSGKTTVGIYRAIRLASQGRRVLVLTYNSTLSSVTKSLIEELIGPLPAKLQVRTLHSVMMEYLRKHSYTPNVPEKSDKTVSILLREALAEVRMKMMSPVLRRDERFFEEEISRVIKGLGISRVNEYKEVERYGRKTALGASQREAVWKVYEAYQRRLVQAKRNDWSDVALLMLQTKQLCSQCQQELDSAGLRTVLHTDSDFDLLEERIKIMTIHSAKGLEFPVVFLLGVVHGTLPLMQGFPKVDVEEAELFIEQQRTLCYVGMTRAAEALYLLTVKGMESRFVQELAGNVVLWQ